MNDFRKFITIGDSLLEKEKYKEAIDNYLNAIQIIDFNISINPSILIERIEKYELLERLWEKHPTVAKDLIPNLIKSKLKLLRNTSKKPLVIHVCYYCRFKLEGSENHCPNCGKNLKSEIGLFLNDLRNDLDEKLGNYDFLFDFFDTNLSKARNLIIYKKLFRNISSDFKFPKFSHMYLLNIVLMILQFTNAIKKVKHPEVLTNSSIAKIHNSLVGDKDISDNPRKSPWGLYKYEVSNFSELELEDVIKGTRRDITITYKDARPDFDYDTYFWAR